LQVLLIESIVRNLILWKFFAQVGENRKLRLLEFGTSLLNSFSKLSFCPVFKSYGVIDSSLPQSLNKY
jgi:hypothetical protein